LPRRSHKCCSNALFCVLLEEDLIVDVQRSQVHLRAKRTFDKYWTTSERAVLSERTTVDKWGEVLYLLQPHAEHACAPKDAKKTFQTRYPYSSTQQTVYLPWVVIWAREESPQGSKA
jgi:hypothetical protein